jgi:hypothetical protein
MAHLIALIALSLLIAVPVLPTAKGMSPEHLTVENYTANSIVRSAEDSIPVPVVQEVSNNLTISGRTLVDVSNPVPYLESKGKTIDDIILFINGLPLKGVHPTGINIKDGSNETTQLEFYLTYNDASADTWRTLLKNINVFLLPPIQKEIIVSIGIENGEAFPKAYENTRTLIIITPLWFWVAVGASVFLLLLVLGLLLTDAYKDQYKDDKGSEIKRSYSLARVQMAFWFFLVIISSIWLDTILWDYNTIPASALGLIGISSITAVTAKAIDETRSQTRTRVGKGLRRFLKDILTDDGESVSLHRVQILVWTLVLGSYFIVTVLTSLAMPEFNATLLTLMGFTSGTYLGFKFANSEPAAPAPAAPAPAAPAPAAPAPAAPAPAAPAPAPLGRSLFANVRASLLRRFQRDS